MTPWPCPSAGPSKACQGQGLSFCCLGPPGLGALAGLLPAFSLVQVMRSSLWPHEDPSQHQPQPQYDALT